MMNGYKAFYNRQTTEIYAETLLQAKLKAIEFFKVPKSKIHMVSVLLCEQNGEQVIHSTATFG